MKFKLKKPKKIKIKFTKSRRVGAPKSFMDFCLKQKAFAAALFIFAIAVALLIYKSAGEDYEGILAIENGLVVALDMERISGNQISLNVQGELGESSVQKEVVFKHEAKKEKTVDADISDSEKISVEVSRIVRDINRGEEGLVTLPKLSPEGAKLSWTAPEKGKDYLFPLAFPVLIMFFAYRDAQDKEKQQEKSERESILRELPSFNNKLLLLMESGLIYEDAVERISEVGDGSVEKIFSKAIREAKITNGRAERIIGDYAREKKISELSRLISIISESRDRGTDLREKLRGEGEILWEKRKRQAEEQGKLADTKLALPLGMMLVSLLLVTAAPALMQF